MNFPKPANWQDFQIFVKDLLNEKFEGGFDIYGRNGQAQNGIDIIGRYNKSLIGVQCKRFDSTNMKINLIQKEIVEADKYILILGQSICIKKKQLEILK